MTRTHLLLALLALLLALPALATNHTNETTEAPPATAAPDKCANDHSRHSPCNRIDDLTVALIAIGSIAGVCVGLFFLDWVCPKKPKEPEYQPAAGYNM